MPLCIIKIWYQRVWVGPSFGPPLRREVGDSRMSDDKNCSPRFGNHPVKTRPIFVNDDSDLLLQRNCVLIKTIKMIVTTILFKWYFSTEYISTKIAIIIVILVKKCVFLKRIEQWFGSNAPLFVIKFPGAELQLNIAPQPIFCISATCNWHAQLEEGWQ